ncbi:DUF1778 domain-containing protein [Mesorhizobium sp. M0159]|uniref:plasmid mobilization protein n=1 Tax=Mesorhizobium sp. M0159 TaxID=2956900 RepID=UPI003339AC05
MTLSGTGFGKNNPGFKRGSTLMRLRVAMAENIKLRVSPEEKRALRAAAMQRGLSLSGFIRQVAAQETGIAA